MFQTDMDCTRALEVCHSWQERLPSGRMVRWEGLGRAVGLGGTGSRKWNSLAGRQVTHPLRLVWLAPEPWAFLAGGGRTQQGRW